MGGAGLYSPGPAHIVHLIPREPMPVSAVLSLVMDAVMLDGNTPLSLGTFRDYVDG